MGERSRTSFTRLFEIRVLHHYWLDDGATEFSTLPDAGARLLRYDARGVVDLVPSRATAAVVAGLQGVFRTTGTGGVVAVPAEVVVPPDAVFEFYLLPRGDYADYTALTLRSRAMVEVTDPAAPVYDNVRRYKANVPVLSNLTGASRGTGAGKRLFLASEYVGGPSNGDGVEALLVSSGNVRQLTADPPAATFQVLGSRTALPVYVHQGDAPPISPPTGTTGTPDRGVELTADMPTTVAAVVRVHPRRSDDQAFSLTEANGRPRTPPRVFELHLRNRWTTRRYRDKNSGDAVATDPEPTPLTHLGNAGTKQKPSPSSLEIERDGGTPSRVTRLISEIYV